MLNEFDSSEKKLYDIMFQSLRESLYILDIEMKNVFILANYLFQKGLSFSGSDDATSWKVFRV